MSQYNFKVEDKLSIVLYYLHSRKTLREIAKLLHKSVRTIQVVAHELEDRGYVINSGGWLGRQVTPTGMEKLKKENYSV